MLPWIQGAFLRVKSVILGDLRVKYLQKTSGDLGDRVKDLTPRTDSMILDRGFSHSPNLRHLGISNDEL